MRSGNRLASERELLGLSQDSLALAAGVAVAVVDRVERNLGQPDEIEKISDVLRLDGRADLDEEEDYLDDPFDEPQAVIANSPPALNGSGAGYHPAIDSASSGDIVKYSTAMGPLMFGVALMFLPGAAAPFIGDDPSDVVMMAITAIAVLGAASVMRGFLLLKKALEQNI